MAAGLVSPVFAGREAELTLLAGAFEDVTAGELGVLLPDFGTSPAGADPGTARARLFEVLLTLCETLAEQQPLVLVVEDVQGWPEHLLDDR